MKLIYDKQQIQQQTTNNNKTYSKATNDATKRTYQRRFNTGQEVDVLVLGSVVRRWSSIEQYKLKWGLLVVVRVGQGGTRLIRLQVKVGRWELLVQYFNLYLYPLKLRVFFKSSILDDLNFRSQQVYIWSNILKIYCNSELI